LFGGLLQRFWYLRRLVFGAFLLALAVGALLAAAMAWRSAQKSVEYSARRAVLNVERLIDRTSADIEKLDALTEQSCDEQTIQKLKDAVYASTAQIRELGLIKGTTLYCTNFGAVNVDLGSVADALKLGTFISAGPNVVVPNNASVFVYVTRQTGRTVDAVLNPSLMAEFERSFAAGGRGFLSLSYTGAKANKTAAKPEVIFTAGAPEVVTESAETIEAEYSSTRFPLVAKVTADRNIFWDEYWTLLRQLLLFLVPLFMLGAFVFDRVLASGVLNRARYKQALRRGQFKVFYQPIVASRTRRIVGVEALLRWDHPKLGMMRAAQFSELFNDTGMEEPVARFVLATVAKDLQNLPVVANHLWCSINIAPGLLEQPAFATSLMLTAKQLTRQRLRIEVTERTPLSEAAEVTIRELRGHGVKVGLDDFGTGYSNINQLQTLAFDFIKLDGLLIRGIQFADGVSPVLDSVIDLASKLNTEIVAEGIEGTIQAQALTSRNVRFLQGYLFSQAKPLADILTMISQEHAFDLTRTPEVT
jgi:sensor c-di-GMP phosphodiesterase-like protein